MKRLTTRATQQRKIDQGVSIGALTLAVLFAAGLLLSGSALVFFNIYGLLFVVGGSLAAVCIQFSLEDLRYTGRQVRRIVRPQPLHTVSERIQYLSSLAKLVKKKGLVVLDREAAQAHDSFLCLALELASDRHESEEIARVLENEISSSHERDGRAIRVLEALGGYAPAIGLIGTLVGLVGMLDALQAGGAVGGSMAIALLSTLYGAILGNLLCLPLAGRIRDFSQKNERLKRVTVEGFLSLVREEGPVILEQKLKSFAA